MGELYCFRLYTILDTLSLTASVRTLTQFESFDSISRVGAKDGV